MPRRVRLRAQEAATGRLAQELRRPPTEDEVAEELGMEVAEYRAFLERYSRAHVASLEARTENEGAPGIEYGSLLAYAPPSTRSRRPTSKSCAPSSSAP